MKEEFNDNYLKIKEQAIEDSKKIDFSNMNNDDRLKEALKMVREKDLSDVKEQMIYVANLLVPDDKEFSDKWNENDKSIKKTAEFYGVPDYVVNVKVSGLNKELENEEESNLNEQEEVNLEINPIELDKQEEPFSKIESVMDSVVKENITDQNVQKEETIKAIADIDLFIKKTSAQASELELLQKKLEELENSNEELIQLNKEKDMAIEEQESEIAKLKKTKNELEEQNENKDKTISKLNEENSSLEVYKNDYEKLLDYLKQNLFKDETK